jgi:hypothetical protein
MQSDDFKPRKKNKAIYDLLCAYLMADQENHKITLIKIVGSWLGLIQVPSISNKSPYYNINLL